MSRLRALLLVLGLAVCALLAPAPTRAGQVEGPQLQASVDAPVVAVGDVVTLTLDARSTIETPKSPLPGAIPAGLAIVGTTSTPMITVGIVNGVRTDGFGLTTVWRLQATKPGTYVIGPPSVVIAGVKHSARPVRVQVVPAGSVPPRLPPSPLDPFGGSPLFDPFRGLFPPGMFDQEPVEPPEPPQPASDPKLAIGAPRDPIAFLHATLDKDRARVGEQVTLTIYLYTDASLREPEVTDVHEATTAAFLRRSLMSDDNRVEHVGFARAGGRTWSVKVARRVALFPLHAGDLPIGPMRLSLVGVRGNRERSSEPLAVHVEEPPATGRPPGFASGDVGRFALSAEVAPREVKRGEAVSVTVELSGTGNLPSSLPIPRKPGVDWLEPEIKDALARQPGDKWGGTRRFSWVVKLDREGDVELGEIALPYFDPEANAYATAAVALGKVKVLPGAAAGAPDDRPFPDLPPVRASLGATRSARAHLSDAPWFWGGLAAPPVAFALLVLGSTVRRKAMERLSARKASPARELAARLSEAEEAAAGKDGGAIDAATLRFLGAAALAHVGVNVKGGTTDEVVRALEERGVEKDVAAALGRLLRACEEARFAPEGATQTEATQRFERAKELAERLRKTRPGSARG
jgi:hypothetical protein